MRSVWSLCEKPPNGFISAVERLLAGMAERRVAEIVRQRQRLGQILVETERAADRARDLRHFEAVGQPGAVVVALVIDEDLRLVVQPPKRGRMDDAVAVALKRRTGRMLRFRMEPPAGLLRFRRIGRETDRGDHSSSYARPSPASIPPAKPSQMATLRQARHNGQSTPSAVNSLRRASRFSDRDFLVKLSQPEDAPSWNIFA